MEIIFILIAIAVIAGLVFWITRKSSESASSDVVEAEPAAESVAVVAVDVRPVVDTPVVAVDATPVVETPVVTVTEQVVVKPAAHPAARKPAAKSVKAQPTKKQSKTKPQAKQGKKPVATPAKSVAAKTAKKPVKK